MPNVILPDADDIRDLIILQQYYCCWPMDRELTIKQHLNKIACTSVFHVVGNGKWSVTSAAM